VVDAENSKPVHDMHGVDGRVVVVTGAGQGVGRGIAHHLGKGGASVVVAEWKADTMQRTVDELSDLGVPVLGVLCDINQPEQIHAMVDATVDRFGKVDGLVNNAQTFRPMAPVAEVTEDDLDVFYRSGMKGSLWAMQAVYPHMKAQGWGRIVNFASSMGITGGRGFAAYNASKEAIRGLTRTAAREWGSPGTHANCRA
jgi:2-hydroxycyclohexanecarboxyl-CoA dehydrogenase